MHLRLRFRFRRRISQATALLSLAALLAFQASAVPFQASADIQEQVAITDPSLVNTPKFDTTQVVVKFKDEADIQLVGDKFNSASGQNTDKVNSLVNRRKRTHKKHLVSEQQQAEVIASADAATAETTKNLDDYFVVDLGRDQANAALAANLQKSELVESVYAKPLPAPTPATPNLSSLQRYLSSAPTGMSVNATIGTSTKQYPAINGSKIKVADIEYSWNTQHEDLNALRASGALWPNGTPVDPFNDTNHGTAAASIIAGSKNGIGVDGIVPNVEFHMVNAYSKERGWDVAGAIYTAAARMSAGDVILLEQQAWAPDYMGFAPVEIYPAEYDAIRYATSRGIIVIEPAANGRFDRWEGYNLDSPLFNGVFTTSRAHSGAIMVGAGSACPGSLSRARLGYSNYGSRVDVQGFGECVTAAGYGDAYNGGGNALYTSSFNGTSSASATIAGVAAELSSSFKQTNGYGMSPAHVKAALRYNSSPQYNAAGGNIGPLPNMSNALRMTDLQAPSTPTSFSSRLTSANKPSLRWNAAYDNLGVVTYYIYRNGNLYWTTNGITFTDKNTMNGTAYTYRVVAVDSSSLQSPATATLNVQTH